MKKLRVHSIIQKAAGFMLVSVLLFSTLNVHAQEIVDTPDIQETNQVLSAPVDKAIIQLTDESATEEAWGISSLETYGLKFLIRGKDALSWSLSIKDGGFHNPAIEKTYAKVLTIVNSLFILGLLAIALMWMFSLLIPRRALKKVILIYSLAVIFINFALPINQLFIDGTNLLQKTLLTKDGGIIEITDIIESPSYLEALSYKNENGTSVITEKLADKTTLKLDGLSTDSTSIGKIKVPAGETIQEEVISLNNQEITLLKDRRFNVHQEQTVFRFAALMTTGFAYFLIALIFVLRIVILWALLILSPILLPLAVFQSTRGWFYNWLSLYGRWLFIGPLTALGIAIVVNIWQLSGLPISMNDGYTSEIFSTEKITNIAFYLPGTNKANTLSSTEEMMEYILFLIMLYLPIFLGFALTRQKVIQESLMTVVKAIRNSKHSDAQLIQQVLSTHNHQHEEKETRDRPTGIIESFRSLMNTGIGHFAEKAMPLQKLKVTSSLIPSIMPTASNFLPENLSQLRTHQMLESLGQNNQDKESHSKVIEKLAHFESITDKKEREKVSTIATEIRNRAEQDDKDAMTILNEVNTLRQQHHPRQAEPQNLTNLNLSINESKPEDKKAAPILEPNLKPNKETKKENKKEEGEKKDEANQLNENKSTPPNSDAHAN